LSAFSGWLNDTLSGIKTNIAKLGIVRADKLRTQPPKPPVITSATANATDPSEFNGIVVSGPGEENPDDHF